MIERKGLFIYFDNMDALNRLDKNLIHVLYSSEKEQYALIYFDKNRYNQVVENLKKNKNITSYEDALTDVEKYNF